MRIGVMSPSRKQGITTASILIASAFADTQGTKVCLVHTGEDNFPINNALGIEELNDITKSFTQLVKLLEAEAISGKEVSDYCTKVSLNLDVLHLSSESVSREVSSKHIPFLIESLEHDVVVVDIDTEPQDPITLSIMKNIDFFVVVLSQSNDVYRKLELWKEYEYLAQLEKKGIMYVFNQYDQYTGAFRNASKSIGVRHTRCCRISYNPFIRRMSNENRLHQIIEYVVNRDAKVVELNNDIKEILQVITANLLGHRLIWRDK